MSAKSFYENIFSENVLYCILCFRSEHERKMLTLSKYKLFTSNMKRIGFHPTRKTNLNLHRQKLESRNRGVCVICDSRLLRGLQLVRAIVCADRFESTLNNLFENKLECQDSLNLKKDMEQVHRLSNLVVTETLYVSSDDVPSSSEPERHVGATPVSRTPMHMVRNASKSVNDYLERIEANDNSGTIVVEDKDDCVVIIETGIVEEQDSNTQSEEGTLIIPDTVVIDESDESNGPTEVKNEEAESTSNQQMPILNRTLAEPTTIKNPTKPNQPTVVIPKLDIPGTLPPNTQIILHPIIYGPDNLLYVPTISNSAIVDHNLPMLQNHNFSLASNYTPQNQLKFGSAPNLISGTGNAVVSSANSNVNMVTSSNVNFVSNSPTPGFLSTENTIVNSSSDKNTITMIVNGQKVLPALAPKASSVNHSDTRILTVGNSGVIDDPNSASRKVRRVQPYSRKKKVVMKNVTEMNVMPEDSMLQNHTTTVKIEDDEEPSTARAASVASNKNNNSNRNVGVNVVPLLKDGYIDWEDKIPMDVITYLDSEPPVKCKNKTCGPLGFIMDSYSQAADKTTGNTKKKPSTASPL